jgi:hypothetical protein
VTPRKASAGRPYNVDAPRRQGEISQPNPAKHRSFPPLSNSSSILAKGNPDVGTIRLDDKQPFALIHVQFDGTTGRYEVVPIVTVTDSFGRNRTKVRYESNGVWPAVGVLNFPDANKLGRWLIALYQPEWTD